MARKAATRSPDFPRPVSDTCEAEGANSNSPQPSPRRTKKRKRGRRRSAATGTKSPYFPPCTLPARAPRPKHCGRTRADIGKLGGSKACRAIRCTASPEVAGEPGRESSQEAEAAAPSRRARKNSVAQVPSLAGGKFVGAHLTKTETTQPLLSSAGDNATTRPISEAASSRKRKTRKPLAEKTAGTKRARRDAQGTVIAPPALKLPSPVEVSCLRDGSVPDSFVPPLDEVGDGETSGTATKLKTKRDKSAISSKYAWRTVNISNLTLPEPWVPPFRPKRSPYCLIQEILYEDPWKLLVATKFLNKTTARAAIPIMMEFFRKYPNALACAQATKSDIVELMRPLGLQNNRADHLIGLSVTYLLNPRTKRPDKDIFSIGKYGYDSWKLFCWGEEGRDLAWASLAVEDKELKKYVEWRREEEALGANAP